MLQIEGMKALPNKEQVLSFLEMVPIFPHIALDVEGDPELDLFLGFSIAFLDQAIYLPVAHMEEDANVDDDTLSLALKVSKENPLRIFQNAAYDLEKFKTIDTEMDGAFADTMVMAHMIDENLPAKDLDALCRHFLHEDVGKERHTLMQGIIDVMGWRYVPTTMMAEYCCTDGIITSKLFTALEPLFEDQFGSMFGESN